MVALVFAVEVVGFSEEEGVRFRVPFIGSRALVGDPLMDDAVLQAIRDFELDPADLPKAVARDAKGYLEFHIEQGTCRSEWWKRSWGRAAPTSSFRERRDTRVRRR